MSNESQATENIKNKHYTFEMSLNGGVLNNAHHKGIQQIFPFSQTTFDKSMHSHQLNDNGRNSMKKYTAAIHSHNIDDRHFNIANQRMTQ